MTSTPLHQEYYNAKQLKLPLDYEVLIPYDSEARTFDEVFRRIDIKKYLVDGNSKGRTGYNPVNMFKLILFCQMEKITSLRAMAKAAQNDIRLMWLTDETKPSHDTIKRFMEEHLKGNIEELFQELNQVLIREEAIDTTNLFIDGTKIEANANRYQFVWKGSIEKFREKLIKKTSKVIERINQRLEWEGVYFPIQTDYQPDDLKKTLAYLENEVERQEIKFVYGKGTRKSAIQRDYEDIAADLEKLTKYEKYLAVIGPDRNSCAKKIGRASCRERVYISVVAVA